MHVRSYLDIVMFRCCSGHPGYFPVCCVFPLCCIIRHWTFGIIDRTSYRGQSYCTNMIIIVHLPMLVITAPSDGRNNSIYKLVSSSRMRSTINQNLRVLVFLDYNQRLHSGDFDWEEMQYLRGHWTVVTCIYEAIFLH